MPIDFPSNPISGQTYAYAGQQWEYNGVAWDKIITADIANDSNALYGISGSIYASNLATGLLYGGIISINAGNSAHFDITAGRGQIHASGSTYTSGPFPTFQYVNWPGQTGITLTYLATSDTTWIYVDSAGLIQQRPTYYTDEQLEETIIIGQLVHPSRTFINLARTNPNVAYATDKQYEQFIRAFGPIKVSGHTISANGANLKLNRTSGTAFSLGRNWINDTDNPSVVSDGAYTDCTFFRYYRGATAGTFITVPNQTAIDPTKYDNGSGTLQTVPGGKYTIQRIFYFPNTPSILGVYYGRAEYTSLADAAANINFENFTEIENTRTNAIFVAYLLVKGGASDLTNASDALILQAGSFRSTTSGGGSVSLTLDDLTDVIITSPQNYQVLTYVDGVTGWENLSVTSLPLVSSLRGLTGAVGITNGSGIGLSVSGNTLTVSNTGVLNIDGSTGAITNVARTNVDNNFSAPQTINAFGAVFGIYDTLNSAGVTIDPLSNDIIWTNGLNQSTLDFNPQGQVVTLPNITTTLAGLSGTQTFGGTKTFNALTTFNGGISSAGGTFGALTRFTAGISASGGMTLAGSFQGSTATFGGRINCSAGISASGSILLNNTSIITVDTYNTSLPGLRVFLPQNTLNPSELSTYGIEIYPNNEVGYDEGAGAVIKAVGATDDGGDYVNNLILSTQYISSGQFGGSIIIKPKDFSALEIDSNVVFSSVPFLAGVTATFAGNIIGKLVNSINGITGAVNIAAGSNITITPSGLTLTIASTASGGFSRSINTITSSTTAGSTANIDYVYNGNTSGNIDLTLPTAVSNTNRYTVKNSNIGILTVLTTSSQTIDGITGYALSKQYQAIDLLSDNSNWFIV
jgi:hypothetical protein